MALLLGVDTGGTYTDAVLIRDEAEVIATAKGSANMMPPILAAVQVGCTVGEISAALRSVWGEHREAMVL